MANKITNNVLEGNLEVFIIPNQGGLITNWLSESVQNEFKKNIGEIAELSGREFNPETDKIVQLWFTGMDCDNMVDHYAWAEDENGNKLSFRASNIGHLPASFFDGKKEGDTIDISFPVRAYDSADRATDITVKAHVTLAQSKYRYRRFGNFEDVLAKVV